MILPQKKPAYYTLFGILFFVFWFLFKVGGFVHIPSALLSTLVDVLTTLTVLVVAVEILVPRLIYSRKYFLFSLSYAAIILCGSAIIIFSQLQLLGQSLTGYQEELSKYKEHFFYWFWADLIFGSFTLLFFVSSVGMAIRLAFDRATESHNVVELQKDKALAELKFLRDQINPHFLFNALNTIYYKIDVKNVEGRDTLHRFSEMLRYQLYDCDAPLVDVEQELHFLKSYIELQKERLNDNYSVHYKGFGDVSGVLIAPHLFLPLIENCFKHVSDHSEKENIIVIECRLEGRSLLLTTFNTVSIDKEVNDEGIGLKNVRKRLDLLYKGKYQLTVRPAPDAFSTSLRLNC